MLAGVHRSWGILGRSCPGKRLAHYGKVDLSPGETDQLDETVFWKTGEEEQAVLQMSASFSRKTFTLRSVVRGKKTERSAWFAVMFKRLPIKTDSI